MKTMQNKKEWKYCFLDDNDINGLTPDLMAPWTPYFLEPPAEANLDQDSHFKLYIQWTNKKHILLQKYGATAIMFPDITPKEFNNNFWSVMHVLAPILRKDCTRHFRRFLDNYGGWAIWRSVIIPEALNYMVTHNAVKCTKVALECKVPELQGRHANPNWMNQYGHFPLHQAADCLNTDMIKLLIANGASANVRTAEDTVIGGLLPLHVAVENTCMHKYLEDNLLPNRKHPIYSKADVYKLIHLLCLPELKIFLDATRELAKHTNDLIGEVCNYIKDGRLVQAGVLLFAAQEYIRLGPSCKKNGNSKPDGFAVIARRITNSFYTLDANMALNKNELEADFIVKHLSSALLLVNVISQAGCALHEYIRVHSKVPHMHVIERVSSILKDFAFCPPEQVVDIGNLHPYKCKYYKELLVNLNFMNQYGQFPLHHAAETFSVPMIKLLISKGASANVRMTSEAVTQGILPLHVAVENTCLHKYLEDNLLLNRDHPSYSKTDVYNLIHLLCLPKMKIFLDAIGELAKHTNDLIGEVCNYVKSGKLVHAGVLLFAAQEHIRLASCSKKNGNSKPDVFATFVSQIADNLDTFDLEMGANAKVLQQPYANLKYKSSVLLLVDIISHAGEALHEYILAHSQVPDADVLERVSEILNDSGFCPTEEGFDIQNICLPKCLPIELPAKNEHMVPTKEDTKILYLNAAGGKIKKENVLPRSLELNYQRELFLPYWRSVLSFVSPIRVFPSHVKEDSFSKTVMQLRGTTDKKFDPVPDENFCLLPRIQQQFNHQTRRSFSTAATLLKVLRNA